MRFSRFAPFQQRKNTDTWFFCVFLHRLHCFYIRWMLWSSRQYQAGAEKTIARKQPYSKQALPWGRNSRRNTFIPCSEPQSRMFILLSMDTSGPGRSVSNHTTQDFLFTSRPLAVFAWSHPGWSSKADGKRGRTSFSVLAMRSWGGTSLPMAPETHPASPSTKNILAGLYS